MQKPPLEDPEIYLPEVTNNDLRRQFFPKHSRTARVFGTLPNYELAISHHTKGTSTPSSHRAPDTRSFKPSSRRIVSRQWGRDRQRNERDFPILFLFHRHVGPRSVRLIILCFGGVANYCKVCSATNHHTTSLASTLNRGT